MSIPCKAKASIVPIASARPEGLPASTGKDKPSLEPGAMRRVPLFVAPPVVAVRNAVMQTRKRRPIYIESVRACPAPQCVIAHGQQALILSFGGLTLGNSHIDFDRALHWLT